jgi:Na+-translocating ferredoxin:NAD+ oxidoreductase subunit B
MTSSAELLPGSLAQQLDALLPQTQCTRCGYPDCASYAKAMATGEANINQCPPGGQAGVERLAQVTQRPVVALNPEHGQEGPRMLAVIDENWCIGCTLCIKACPVDCIIGAPKSMHTVIEDQCTGCELCIPACPVDCISLVPVHEQASPPTGWAAWSAEQAREAKDRFDATRTRRARAQAENDARLAQQAAYKLAHLADESNISDPHLLDQKRAAIEAALARARARKPSKPT